MEINNLLKKIDWQALENLDIIGAYLNEELNLLEKVLVIIIFRLI